MRSKHDFVMVCSFYEHTLDPLGESFLLIFLIMLLDQDNLYTGSSETLRENTKQNCFNFTDYISLLPQHKRKIKQSFLEWFVGFSEGDGSFICTTNKRNIFIINQKHIKVLTHLRSELGFGRVSQLKGYARYTVADMLSVERLIAIFNGNLTLNKTQKRFSLWLCQRNAKTASMENNVIQDISLKPKLVLCDSLLESSHWLSGFIDAEGCFNAQKIQDQRYSLSYRVRLRFCLDQHDEEQILISIRNFLGGGSVAVRRKVAKSLQEDTLLSSFHDDNYMWRLSTWSCSTHQKLQKYLSTHKLLSPKNVDMVRFFSLYNYIINRKRIPWTGKVLSRVENLLSSLKKST